jgi:hypothetical protein
VLGRRRIRIRSARDRNAGGAWLASDVPVKTDAKQLSLDSKIADITVSNVSIVAACCVDAKD